MKQGYWVVRTYEAGIIGEKTKFWVQGERPSGKSRRKEKSEIRKQEQNEYSALKAMSRLANANFHKDDLLLGLDYSEEGLQKITAWARQKHPEFDTLPEEEQQDFIMEAAWHEAELCLRRVAREMKKDGEELRYILITSDMDGETGEQKRVHHHLFVEAGTQEIFVKKWEKLGKVDWKKISKQADYTPICEYFLKQVRRIPDAKKFRSSRNLVRPRPKDRVVLTDAELRVPKGGKLLFRQEYKNWSGTSYQPQYIRYIIPENKRKAADLGGRSDGTEEVRL